MQKIQLTNRCNITYLRILISIFLLLFTLGSQCASKSLSSKNLRKDTLVSAIKTYSAKDFYSVNKRDSTLKIEITNFPKENILLEILKVLIATIIGGLIVWFVSYRTQKKLILKDNFERNLFSLLENQNNILNEITATISSYRSLHDKVTLNGREFFSFARQYMVLLYKFLLDDNLDREQLKYLYFDFTPYDDFKIIHKNSFIRKSEKTDSKKEELSLFVYRFFFNKFLDVYGHYMRHLYRILLFIENEEKNINKFGDVKFYTDMVQARMSTSELFIVFYNGLKYPNAKELVYKYFLIENLRVDFLMDISHRSIYEHDNFKMKEE